MAYNINAYAKVQTSYKRLFFDTRWEKIVNKPHNFPPTSHEHGNLTDDGRIGFVANRVIVTGTGGVLTAKSAGTTSQFLRGDGAWAIPPASIDTTQNYTWTGQHSFRSHIRFSPNTASYYFGAPETGSGYVTLPYNKSGTVALTSDIPAPGVELLRDRVHGGSLDNVNSGTTSGYVVLDKYVSPGDTLMIEVSKYSGGAYNPKIVTVTVGTSSAIGSTTDADYLNSWSYFNGTVMGIYTFTCWAGGSTSSYLYFGAKRYIQGSFSGTNISWTTNNYTLYVGRVWRVNR